MNVNIHPSWKTHLQQKFEKPYFKVLTDLSEYQLHQCFPNGKAFFNAFDRCHFDKTK